MGRIRPQKRLKNKIEKILPLKMNFKKLKKLELKSRIENLYSKRVVKCPKCSSLMRTKIGKREKLSCTWPGCKFEQSLWKNTIFSNSFVSKAKILRVIELWMIKASYDLISYETRLDRKTIWRIMSKVTNILVKNYYSNVKLIGGNNEVVEIDESKFGKRKYNRGHKVDGVWILGMVERTTERKIHLVAVDDRKKETLEKILENTIKVDSAVYTDGWKGYSSLINKFADHLTVNHSEAFKNSENGCHTNTIEGNWAGIKLHVPTRGRTKDKINLYLVRFMLLRNEKMHPLDAALKYLF